MSARINITIPDDLYRDLQEVKGRLNISRICQRAIQREVSLEKYVDESIPDIDKLATRLRKERAEYATYFKDEGYKDGINDAHQMLFEKFRLIDLHLNDWEPRECFDYGASRKSRQRVKDGDFSTESIDYCHSEEFLDLYFEGWERGVFHVWDKVKAKLTE